MALRTIVSSCSELLHAMADEFMQNTTRGLFSNMKTQNVDTRVVGKLLPVDFYTYATCMSKYGKELVF